MTAYYAYLFEAHTIQHYIMFGGKLAEMVGASELLEDLTGQSGPLDDAFNTLKFVQGQDFEFSRRGGGAFFLLFKEQHKALALRDLWSLIVPQIAPGLSWNHTIAEGDNQKAAIENGQAKLRQKRNQPTPVIPESNPLMRLNPRVGLPAICFQQDPDGKQISLDRASQAKLQYAQKGGRLFDKFMTKPETKKYWAFPRNLEHKAAERVFPFKGNNHTIGIIHADGNGLGQILMRLADTLTENTKDPNAYASIFYALSQKIDTATTAAAQKALQAIDEIKNLTPKAGQKTRTLPLRPLILGGDDLTILIRGDLALPYARDFLQLFEQETEQALKALHDQYPAIPKQMTACAGIAFIRSNQPFYLGYQLAESLCSHAKEISRGTSTYQKEAMMPSSLAFYHNSTSMIHHYSAIQAHELTVRIEGRPHLLSMGAYGVGQFSQELPDFGTLQRLKNAFQEKSVARGPVRHILTLMHTDPGNAKVAYRRWREVMDSRDNKTLKLFDETCEILFARSITDANALPFTQVDNDQTLYRSFLNDLKTWLAVEGEPT